MASIYASETEVVNAALSSLGERPIRDYATDTVKAAVEARRWFPATIDDELMKFDWPFAITRVEITADATAPSFGWVSRFALPADCIRFFPLTDNGEDSGNPVSHKVEGGFILSDLNGPIKLRYIKDASTVTEWPSNFSKVFVAALAVKVAENITGLSQAVPSAAARYQEAVESARRFESRQSGTMPEGYSSSWIEARS